MDVDHRVAAIRYQRLIPQEKPKEEEDITTT